MVALGSRRAAEPVAGGGALPSAAFRLRARGIAGAACRGPWRRLAARGRAPEVDGQPQRVGTTGESDGRSGRPGTPGAAVMFGRVGLYIHTQCAALYDSCSLRVGAVR
jgi:hypothetical protein